MCYTIFVKLGCDEESTHGFQLAESRRSVKDGSESMRKNTSELAEESGNSGLIARTLVIRTARLSREDLIKVERFGVQFGWYRGRCVFRPIYGVVYMRMRALFVFLRR